MSVPQPFLPEEPPKTSLRLVQNKPLRAQRGPSPASFRAEEAVTAKEFCGLLDELRKWVEISFMTMQRLTDKKLSKSRAHQIVHADHLPSPEDLTLFLEACNVTAEEASRWRRGANRVLNGPPRESVFESPPPRLAPIPPPPPPKPEPQSPPTQAWPPPSAPQRFGAGATPVMAAPTAEAAPSPQPQFVTPFPAGAKVPMVVTMRALMVFTLVVLLLTGSVTTLWLLRIPSELIMTMLGVVAISVSGWLLSLRWRWQLMVEQQKQNRTIPAYLAEDDPEELFGTDAQTAPPVIGV
ncbi:hypothetical protein ACFORH_20365 [Amycolatopsis roodepoortensis]|uniref:Uncharacterized protein n=1 Tax=Amycolatopsis roodepoortensis TaxID=700274 RepID=A0ABR9LE74_9PSEU|nr:hypothetical protein [Amycolatopsis roodepoortensis]MBE1578827.1 hypothetical protein [Amycolatopsis roodepoortensis]